jgi:hypothetical protein
MLSGMKSILLLRRRRGGLGTVGRVSRKRAAAVEVDFQRAEDAGREGNLKSYKEEIRPQIETLLKTNSL